MPSGTRQQVIHRNQRPWVHKYDQPSSQRALFGLIVSRMHLTVGRVCSNEQLARPLDSHIHRTSTEMSLIRAIANSGSQRRTGLLARRKSRPLTPNTQTFSVKLVTNNRWTTITQGWRPCIQTLEAIGKVLEILSWLQVVDKDWTPQLEVSLISSSTLHRISTILKAPSAPSTFPKRTSIQLVVVNTSSQSIRRS